VEFLMRGIGGQTMRDRLIELLEKSPRLDAMYGEYDVAADWLIANGVIVKETVGDDK
jgi:hypothetical protein